MIDAAFSSAVGLIMNPSLEGGISGALTSLNSTRLVTLQNTWKKRETQLFALTVLGILKFSLSQTVLKDYSGWSALFVTSGALYFRNKRFRDDNPLDGRHVLDVGIISNLAPSAMTAQFIFFALRQGSEACCNHFLQAKQMTQGKLSKLATCFFDASLASTIQWNLLFPLSIVVGLYSEDRVSFTSIGSSCLVFSLTNWIVGSEFLSIGWLNEYPLLPWLLTFGHQCVIHFQKSDQPSTSKSVRYQKILDEILEKCQNIRLDFEDQVQECLPQVQELFDDPHFDQRLPDAISLLKRLRQLDQTRNALYQNEDPVVTAIRRQRTISRSNTENTIRNLRERVRASESIAAESLQDSLTLDTILSQDHYLGEFLCGISHKVPLDPCIEPTNPMQIYEYTELEKWIADERSSPTTREEVHTDQIIRLPNLKAFIAHRIENFSEEPDETLLRAAEAELARYREANSAG